MINDETNVITNKVENDVRTGFIETNWGCSIISGSATIKRAFAGAGSPLKSFCWSSSILNLAKRMPAARGIRNPTKAKGANENVNSLCRMWVVKFNSRTPISKNKLYITIPGTNPLVIKSAIESNWRPKLLSTFSKRAKKPSKRSKKAPRKTNKKAASNKFLKAK